MERTNATKYPSEIMEGVKKILMNELQGKSSNTELEGQIEAMAKVEVMDKYLESLEKEISGSEIFHVVNQVFGFDLDGMSVLSEDNAELLDASSSTEIPLSRYGDRLTFGLPRNKNDRCRHSRNDQSNFWD